MQPTPDESEQIDWDDPDAVIAYCEARRASLKGYADATDPREIEQLIITKLHYCNALGQKGDHTQALTHALHADELADRLDESAAPRRLKEHAQYWVGRTRALRGEHLTACRILRPLAGSDPIHECVHYWLRFCRLWVYYKVFLYIFYAALALFMLWGAMEWTSDLTWTSTQVLRAATTGLGLTSAVGMGMTRRKLQRLTSE